MSVKKETKNEKYLRMFFEEKEIPYKVFEVNSKNGTPNSIPNEAVIEQIMAAPEHEKEQIANIIRRIDFANGDVNHFLGHLAGAMAQDLDF